MKNNRPVSPHITIYKLQLNSALSILHRGTGGVLTLGFIGFIFFFNSLTFNLSSYEFYYVAYHLNALNNWFVNFIFLGFLFSFYYHLVNGMRHLYWDLGYGLNLKELYSSAYVTLILTVILTLGTWLIL